MEKVLKQVDTFYSINNEKNDLDAVIVNNLIRSILEKEKNFDHFVDIDDVYICDVSEVSKISNDREYDYLLTVYTHENFFEVTLLLSDSKKMTKNESYCFIQQITNIYLSY